MLDFSVEEADLEEEFPESLFVEALFSFESEETDLEEDDLPEEVLVVSEDFEPEPAEPDVLLLTEVLCSLLLLTSALAG